MSDTSGAVNPNDQGDGSGDPNRDREFLQNLPPAQVDDAAVHASAEDSAEASDGDESAE